MPNHGKGGRKPEGDEVKRSAVAVRTTPAIKARLAEAAQEAGRSVTQEIEARLEASMAYDQPERTPETIRLLGALAADIERAEKLTGKRWHRDLRTWAMVREALAEGEIERQCPPYDRLFGEGDSDTDDIRRELDEIADKLKALVYGIYSLNWIVCINPASFSEIMADRYDYADSEKQLDEGGGKPEHVPAIREIIAKMKELEAARKPLAAAYLEQTKLVVETIEEAVLDWRADLEARGVRQPREYRPTETLRPVIDNLGRLTGGFVRSPATAVVQGEGDDLTSPEVLIYNHERPHIAERHRLTRGPDGVPRTAEAHRAREKAKRAAETEQ